MFCNEHGVLGFSFLTWCVAFSGATQTTKTCPPKPQIELSCPQSTRGDLEHEAFPGRPWSQRLQGNGFPSNPGAFSSPRPRRPLESSQAFTFLALPCLQASLTPEREEESRDEQTQATEASSTIDLIQVSCLKPLTFTVLSPGAGALGCEFLKSFAMRPG